MRRTPWPGLPDVSLGAVLSPDRGRAPLLAASKSYIAEAPEMAHINIEFTLFSAFSTHAADFGDVRRLPEG